MTARVFDDEHEVFRDSFRAFVEREAGPGKLDAAVLRSAGESGFLGIQVAEQYGGGGVADPRFGVVAAEELARAGLTGLALAFSTHSGVAALALADHGRPDLLAHWLPDLVSGVRLATVVEAPRTLRCEPHERGVRLDGIATAVVSGEAADLFVVVGQSGQGERRVVAVDGRTEGVHRKPVHDSLGLPGAGIADVHFDAVAVPPSAVLGDGAAEQVCVDASLWAAVLGIAGARAALSWTVDYVRERKVFGRAVADFANTREVLAAVAADLTVVGSFVDQCGQARVHGELTVSRAAVASLRATELFATSADQGLQLHGGYGYIREYPIAQAFADARYLGLLGGSADVSTDLLAAELGL